MAREPSYVDAIVVNTRRRGPGQMLGMGDATTTLLDAVTGGTYQALLDKLDTVSLLLKVSTAAALIAGIAGVAILFRGDRR
jgi:hypothetical protein